MNFPRRISSCRALAWNGRINRCSSLPAFSTGCRVRVRAGSYATAPVPISSNSNKNGKVDQTKGDSSPRTTWASCSIYAHSPKQFVSVLPWSLRRIC